MRIILVIFCLTILAGCPKMPVTTVNAVDNRPSISLSGVEKVDLITSGTSAADLYIDGLRMGKASDFETPNRLKLEAGTHKVAIKKGDKVLFEQTVFIESEHKNINVR
jgi:hypothetical protein